MSTPEVPDGRTPEPADRAAVAGDRTGPAPAEDRPAGRLAQPAPAPGPVGAGTAPPRTPGPPTGRGWSSRRRWLTAGVAVLALLAAGGIGFGVGRHAGGPGHWDDRAGAPHWTAWQDGPGRGGPGFGPGQDDHPSRGGGPEMRGFDGGPGMGPERGPWMERYGGFGWDGRRGGHVVTGSVVSTGEGTLVVAVDSGAQTSFTITDRTRVRGAGNGVTGLQPGQRVVVRVGPDNAARAVLAPVARAFGTVTALDGDRATLVRPDGLTEVVDVTAANPKPVVGDRVAVQGVPADNGATIKAQSLRVLPRSS